MTPADLERVRVALEYHCWGIEYVGSHPLVSDPHEVCECGERGPTETDSLGTDWWIEHIVAVLAAQDEETE